LSFVYFLPGRGRVITAQPLDPALCVLLGEAVLLGSFPLLLWFGSRSVLAVNAVYLPLVEEPGLSRRFGEDYESYRTHVPRWCHACRPWDPAS